MLLPKQRYGDSLWPWIEHTNYQLRSRHSTTELLPLHDAISSCNFTNRPLFDAITEHSVICTIKY